MTRTVSLGQFRGCLLGEAIGDGLGAPFEGIEADILPGVVAPEEIVPQPCDRRLRYTDDTQMMIGVAETLAEHRRIVEEELCAAFVRNYNPFRGYGMGARRLIEAMAEGRDWRTLAQTMFRGGSYGNGGAMRVAPVGIFFSHDLDRVAEEAALSARLTHRHPLGIDGARVLALAVALAAREEHLDRPAFFDELAARAQTEEFQQQLSEAGKLKPTDGPSGFGNGIEAHRSVVTAIDCFACAPDSYTETVRRAIAQGGDTDTLAAMAGAISGAHLGADAIPDHLIAALEDDHQGRTYIDQLAERLFEAYGRQAGA